MDHVVVVITGNFLLPAAPTASRDQVLPTAIQGGRSRNDRTYNTRAPTTLAGGENSGFLILG
jgi:hypothetical protein